METKDQISKVLNDLNALLIAKNTNYGNSAMQEPSLLPGLTPRQGILVRLSDKIARLQTLAGGAPDKVGEVFDDTLLDLAGYVVLYFACEK